MELAQSSRGQYIFAYKNGNMRGGSKPQRIHRPQLSFGIFIDKVLMISDEFKIRFFRNEEYSLHEINGVISRSLGLTLVFEVFKKCNYKTFLDIPFEHTDKNLMIEVLNTQCVRYLYILKIISEIVLATEKGKLTGTKINKTIRE